MQLADTRSDMRRPEDPISSSTLRVVLVDDRAARRDIMRQVVGGDGTRASVVADADSRASALLVVGQHGADAVVVDIRMPVAEGLRTVADLRQAFPRLGIVVCSFDLDPVTVREALDAGAHTCLAKPASRQQLLGALEGACSEARSAGGSAGHVAVAAGAC